MNNTRLQEVGFVADCQWSALPGVSRPVRSSRTKQDFQPCGDRTDRRQTMNSTKTSLLILATRLGNPYIGWRGIHGSWFIAWNLAPLLPHPS